MFARVSTYEGSPELIDEAIRYAREQILPRAQQLEGYKGAYLLVDRQSGKSVSVTLWESEQAMRASEEAANQLRSESAEASGGAVVSVERYEVAVSPEEIQPGGEQLSAPPRLDASPRPGEAPLRTEEPGTQTREAPPGQERTRRSELEQEAKELIDRAEDSLRRDQ